MADGGRWIVYDVAGAPADLATVELLARLALATARAGRQLRLVGMSSELRELVELVGLAEVLRG